MPSSARAPRFALLDALRVHYRRHWHCRRRRHRRSHMVLLPRARRSAPHSLPRSSGSPLLTSEATHTVTNNDNKPNKDLPDLKTRRVALTPCFNSQQAPQASYHVSYRQTHERHSSTLYHSKLYIYYRSFSWLQTAVQIFGRDGRVQAGSRNGGPALGSACIYAHIASEK